MNPNPEHGEAESHEGKFKDGLPVPRVRPPALCCLRHLLLILTRDLARSWVHRVDPLADNAGDRLIAFGIIRNLLGNEP
jgi:hypothetical protein